MTRLNIGTWTPAVFDPAFPGGKFFLREISEIEYIVGHDAVGFRGFLRAGNRIQGDHPNPDYGRASWFASNLTDGQFLEHHEIEQATWTSGTTEANRKGLAIENENERTIPLIGSAADRPINDAQVDNLALCYVTLKGLGAPLLPPFYGQGFRHHSDLTGGATTCPNNRFGPNGERWADVREVVLSLEEIMEEVVQIKRFDLVNGGGKFWRLDENGRTLPINAAQLRIIRKMGESGAASVTETKASRSDAERAQYG